MNTLQINLNVLGTCQMSELQMADINDFLLLKNSNALRELQSASGEELRPFFGRTLTSSPSIARGMPSILDMASTEQLQEKALYG